MADEQGTPEQNLQSGFEGEVRRHFPTRAEVQDLLQPLSKELHQHLGYHEGFRFTAALVIPLFCVLITATAIIIGALV